MNPSRSAQQVNLDVVAQVGALIGTGFADPDEDLFAQDFVFHFFNPRLPELAGDHHGFDGFRSLFERLQQGSDTGFHNEPHSLTPYGDELVVAHATNTVSFGGIVLDVDAIVVWRVVGGRIHEAWDIPAINTVRPMSRTGNELSAAPRDPRRLSLGYFATPLLGYWATRRPRQLRLAP